MAEHEGLTLHEWYDKNHKIFRKHGIDVDKIDVNITLEEELVLIGLSHKGVPYPCMIQKPKHDSMDATTLADSQPRRSPNNRK